MTLSSCLIPSVVRLQVLDDCLCMVAGTDDLGGTFLPIVGPTPEDWELRTALVRRRIAPKDVGEVVEARPEVMEHVSDQYAPFEDGRILLDFNADQILSRRRVRIGERSIGVAFVEPLNRLVEHCQMLVSAGELRLDAI